MFFFMKNGRVYFNVTRDGFEFSSVADVPQNVFLFIDCMRFVYKSDAFRFIRFEYPDIKLELWRHICDRYEYSVKWVLRD